jgi:hypothetical protein
MEVLYPTVKNALIGLQAHIPEYGVPVGEGKRLLAMEGTPASKRQT